MISLIQGSWEKKIVERVHNVRSASARKRPSAENEGCTPHKKGRPKASPTLSRYPPLADMGNDEVSNARNLQMLCREMERDKPRRDTVLSLMRQTFTSRREYVLSESSDISVAAILQLHQALSLPYVVSINTKVHVLVQT